MAARLAAIRIMHGWRQSRGAAVPCRRDADRARREVKKDPTSTRTPLLQSQLLLYLLHIEQSLQPNTYHARDVRWHRPAALFTKNNIWAPSRG